MRAKETPPRCCPGLSLLRFVGGSSRVHASEDISESKSAVRVKFEMTFFFSRVTLMMPPLFETVVILRFGNFRAKKCFVFENPTFHVVLNMEPLAAHMDNSLRQTDGFLFGYRPSDYPLTEEYFAFGELLMTLLLA